MAFNDIANKFGKGGPPGLGIGLKLLAVGGALVYGASKSVYTGKNCKILQLNEKHNLNCFDFFFYCGKLHHSLCLLQIS